MHNFFFYQLAFSEDRNIFTGIENSYFKTIIFNSDSTVCLYDDASSESSETNYIWNNKFYYEIINENGFNYLILKNDKFDLKFFILKSDEALFIYKTDESDCIFSGMKVSVKQVEGIYFPSNIKASSELIEGKKVYSINNVCNFNIDEPWSEGVSGNGIGEKITFGINGFSIYIIPGFVSAKKSYLYYYNSRPKKIEINFCNISKKITYDLVDEPVPQKIDFGFYYEGKIEVSIVDVYSGSKYEDTCITSIFCNHFN